MTRSVYGGAQPSCGGCGIQWMDRYEIGSTDPSFDEIKEYVSGQVERLVNAMAGIGSGTLEEGKTYTDEKVSEGIQEAKEYVDQAIADLGKMITDLKLEDNGDLIATFNDGSTETVGNIRNKVYVPHIDKRKILSFTVEDNEGEVPEPVDLNPFDEWKPIGGEASSSDYIWEGI